jgi:hypothetical protein
MVEVETIPWLWHMFYSISLYFGLVLAMGVVTIKQAKKNVGCLPKLYKNCNFVRCIFVVPL